MNAGLVNHGNRRLAGRIIQTISPKGRLGILTPDRPIVIRGPDNPDELKGFELLRIWPLSLISIQAIFLGIITLLALWPVFGRPRRIAKESTTDFGKHVEAMGLLLQETNDRYYAAIKIAEYFRDVRKEPNSVWATILSEEQAITPTITTATSQSGLIQPKTTPSTTP